MKRILLAMSLAASVSALADDQIQYPPLTDARPGINIETVEMPTHLGDIARIIGVIQKKRNDADTELARAQATLLFVYLTGAIHGLELANQVCFPQDVNSEQLVAKVLGSTLSTLRLQTQEPDAQVMPLFYAVATQQYGCRPLPIQ